MMMETDGREMRDDDERKAEETTRGDEDKDGESVPASSFWTDGGGRKYLENMQAKPRRIPLRLGNSKTVRSTRKTVKRASNVVACTG